MKSKEALKTHLCGEKGILLHHLWDGEFKENKEKFTAGAIALVEDRMKEINHV